jgi:hypothetical protein
VEQVSIEQGETSSIVPFSYQIILTVQKYYNFKKKQQLIAPFNM